MKSGLARYGYEKLKKEFTMQSKKPHTPMVRIQERAPEDRWMRDAQIPPSPVHQSTGIVDAADLYRKEKLKKDAAAAVAAGETPVETAAVQHPRSSSEAPLEVFEGVNAHALERRTAAAAAEASRADKFEAENTVLEEKLVFTDNALSQAQDGLENMRTRARTLKTTLKEVEGESKQLSKQITELEEDRRTDAIAFAEKIAKAQEQIQELEATQGEEPEEVEVYPSKIVIEEITNTIRKNTTVILKTQVRMDDELVPITIRAPFKKMKAAIDKADTAAEE